MAELRLDLKKRMPGDVHARGEFLNRLVDNDFEDLKTWARKGDKASFEAHVHRMLQDGEGGE
jgi:hypothetical protein